MRRLVRIAACLALVAATACSSDEAAPNVPPSAPPPAPTGSSPDATVVTSTGTCPAQPGGVAQWGDRGECRIVDWDLRTVATDGRTLTIDYYVNRAECAAELDGVETTETDAEVSLVVVVRYDDSATTCPTLYEARSTDVALTQPLGDRTVRGCRPAETFVPQGGYGRPAPRDPAKDCTPPA